MNAHDPNEGKRRKVQGWFTGAADGWVKMETRRMQHQALKYSKERKQ